MTELAKRREAIQFEMRIAIQIRNEASLDEAKD
jgi:hypothetical protein